MKLLPFLIFFFLCIASINAEISSRLGVNYGQLGNNLPTPHRSIQLIQSLNASRVKIYDTNPEILRSISHTNLQISIMLPNELISNVSSNQSFSDHWIRLNVLPFADSAGIRYLLVGNEVLSPFSAAAARRTWLDLVPAMRRISKTLKKLKILKIKVSTPLAIDCIQSVSPPSNGTFRPDIAEPIIRPLLQFLNRTRSYFAIDAYPYFVWSANHTNIRLDYALGNRDEKNLTYADPVSGLSYTNLLDEMLDAVVFAMRRLGFRNVRLMVAETGWPTAGDFDQIGANIYNAATYNRNLVKKFTARPAVGTPARPGAVIPVFVFALYNENQKPGPTTERNWGLLYPNGTRVYGVDLSGRNPEWDKEVLPKPGNNEPYKGKVWCVVRSDVAVNETKLGEAIAYACGQGSGTCDAIQPGRECYEPNTLVAHASYAFGSYWVQFRGAGGTCFFDGLAVQTIRDPSNGPCRYPSVTLSG
ncbi:hypothetical protein Sjap_013485 [Stephania japonica]|uniref:glucan endo-1,3-beta-D-glucosidase n=1 Tax=Stephania japonica TaxID=461633 RepID=A0AAP0IY64_9MAGN